MVFTSIAFLFFFTIFFLLYWFVFNNNLKLQNLFVLIGSYVFYSCADWRFLFYLIGASVLTFNLGIYIEKAKGLTHKRVLLYIGLLQGLGGLIFFKYCNFFINSFNTLFHSLHLNFNLQTLHILIPLGISFFTFRTISYLLDINKGKIKASTDWVVFFTYVSFFPSLLSGPIDKARTFIPQLEKKRVFNSSESIDGLRQILWGLFKKIIIADNCASLTGQLFDNYQTLPASSLLLGSFVYAMQVYADFSGYSDMAIGLSRLIGFSITKNFDYPFFAQNIAEFWRKWHISLTTWVTEYVFTPLSIFFRDYGKLGMFLSILINFIIIGMWHGTNLTYIVFGFIHGCLFIPLILSGTMNKKKKTTNAALIPSFREFINIAVTFAIVMLSFIIFKSDNIGQAVHYYRHLLSVSLFSLPIIPSDRGTAFITLLFISLMLLIEWMERDQPYALAKWGLSWPTPIRWAFYYTIILLVLYYKITHDASKSFIYFQF